MRVGATSLTAIRNIIRVTQAGPLIGPVIYDIVNEWRFYDLIRSSSDSVEDRQLFHFGMTPLHELEKG